MIEPEDWINLVKKNIQLYFFKDGCVVTASTQWFRTLRYSEENGFTCGSGKDIVNLDDLCLSEKECVKEHIAKLKQKYLKDEENK